MNPRTRVKICGITRPQDAVIAAGLGVDAIGLVFYAKSPRFVDFETARAVSDAVPGFVTVVALFLNPSADEVEQVLAEVPIDTLQFHGAEPVDFCRSFNRPYIKALGMANSDLLSQSEMYSDARGLLLDSHATGESGGSGKTFDWQRIPASFRHKIILAGGLNPENVAQAIRQVHPYAVDLSSGVESAPGIKDAARMTRLMNEVKRVDCESV